MFLIRPATNFGEIGHETHRAFNLESKQPSRLDVRRRHLESIKMYHINTMIVDLRAQDMERNLAHQRMLTEARGDRLSLTSRVRHIIGGKLVSMGERIRPELAQNEPQYNA